METSQQTFNLYRLLFQATMPVAVLVLGKNRWTDTHFTGQADYLQVYAGD